MRRLAALALLAAACDSMTASSLSTDGGADARTAGPDAALPIAAPDAGMATIGGSRPVSVHVPPGYTPGTPMPLVIMLHGYSWSGDIEETYLQLTPLADARGFLYAHPDGTVDAVGNRFWNATDACCNLYGSTVDDSTYLSSVITEIEAAYTVDRARVFVIGHSSGAFMAHRLACDHADQLAAIASLAGAQWDDISHCQPSQALSVVEIHGTADTIVPFVGGTYGAAPFPSVATTMADWVALDGCSTTPDASAPALDLDSLLPGSETTITTWATGCAAGGHVELWAIQGGSHIPTLSATFAGDVVDFFYAHHR